MHKWNPWSSVPNSVECNQFVSVCQSSTSLANHAGHLESTQVVKIQKIKTFSAVDRWGKLTKPFRISNLARKSFQLTAYNTFTPFKAQSETTVPVNSAQDKYSVSLLLGTELHGNSCTMWIHMQQTKRMSPHPHSHPLSRIKVSLT